MAYAYSNIVTSKAARRPAARRRDGFSPQPQPTGRLTPLARHLVQINLAHALQIPDDRTPDPDATPALRSINWDTVHGVLFVAATAVLAYVGTVVGTNALLALINGIHELIGSEARYAVELPVLVPVAAVGFVLMIEAWIGAGRDRVRMAHIPSAWLPTQPQQ
jgi:hypothetical protein